MVELRSLEDRRGLIYVWQVERTTSESDKADLALALHQEAIKSWGHAPKALHMVVHDLEEIRRLRTTEAEAYLKPWSLLEDDPLEEEQVVEG